MPFRREPTSLPGVEAWIPDVHPDARGEFRELFNSDRLSSCGFDLAIAQVNFSRSIPGVLRGLHYQLRHPQAKLIAVVRGAIFDVAVDLRRGSPTFGQWTSRILSAENHAQMFVPEGFAHGFCAIGNVEADVVYLCSRPYAPSDEYGIRWNDPTLDISWPVPSPILSARDRDLPLLTEVPPDHMPA